MKYLLSYVFAVLLTIVVGIADLIGLVINLIWSFKAKRMDYFTEYRVVGSDEVLWFWWNKQKRGYLYMYDNIYHSIWHYQPKEKRP